MVTCLGNKEWELGIYLEIKILHFLAFPPGFFHWFFLALTKLVLQHFSHPHYYAGRFLIVQDSLLTLSSKMSLFKKKKKFKWNFSTLPFRVEGHRRAEYGSLGQMYFIAGIYCTYPAIGEPYEAFMLSLIFLLTQASIIHSTSLKNVISKEPTRLQFRKIEL